MDNQKTSKAKFGQDIIEVTALDRSSVGMKDTSAVYGEGAPSFKGGVENLGHSLKGVSAVSEGNGATKGTKGGNLYPSSRG